MSISFLLLHSFGHNRMQLLRIFDRNMDKLIRLSIISRFVPKYYARMRNMPTMEMFEILDEKSLSASQVVSRRGCTRHVGPNVPMRVIYQGFAGTAQPRSAQLRCAAENTGVQYATEGCWDLVDNHGVRVIWRKEP